MKFSKTDRKLMIELQKDGGISYSELATRVNVNPRTVAKRVDRLLKSNAIAIIAQPNPFKLGLSACAFIAIKSDPSKIGHICEQLGEDFHVNLVQTVFGRFDILAILYFPNWDMLHHFINDYVYTIDGVTNIELYSIKETFKRYERFFKKEPFANAQLKESDWTLIGELTRDGRANPSELAAKLGINLSNVYRRISALVKDDLIKISGVPNPSKLTFSANAYILLDVDLKEEEKICESLDPYPEVQFIMTLNRRSGMIVCVHTKDSESLYDFLHTRIIPLRGIFGTETFIRAMVHKTYYGWLIDSNENEGNYDSIIPFNSLSIEIMEKLVDKFMAELNQQLAARRVTLKLSAEARRWLAKEGYDSCYGARPLVRLIQKEIKDALSDEILFGRLEKGGTVFVDRPEDKLTFSYN